jgi:hypothetical protein
LTPELVFPSNNPLFPKFPGRLNRKIPFITMERKKGGKSHLKDLCKEDKAKIGELIEKIASEKKQKFAFKEENDLLKIEIEKLRTEKNQVVLEKERVLVKLDKCMDLLKNLQVKQGPQVVDVYTQTFEKRNDVEMGWKDQQIFDDKFFKLVEDIEMQQGEIDDPLLIKIVQEMEFSDFE